MISTLVGISNCSAVRFYGRSYFTLVVRKTPRLIKNTQGLLPQNLLNLRYIYGPGMRFLWKSQNHAKFIKIGDTQKFN